MTAPTDGGLLPCPFCGKAAHDFGGADTDDNTIGCHDTACAAFGALVTRRQWNRRAPVAAAPPERNQCDGCVRGLPVNAHGHHYDYGLPVMACTAHLYVGVEQPASESGS